MSMNLPVGNPFKVGMSIVGANGIVGVRRSGSDQKIAAKSWQRRCFIWFSRLSCVSREAAGSLFGYASIST
jgi:hypothetical protein